MLGGRCNAGADDLALSPDRVPEVDPVTEPPREEAAGFFDLLRRRPEGFPLDSGCSLELLEPLDPTRGEGPPDRRRLPREHERDGVGVRVGNEPTLEQRVDESRRRRTADLPLRPSPPTRAQGCAHLRKHIVHLFEREALPPHRVPGRPSAEAERIATRVDPLVPPRQRPERVRVLRDLTQHPADATSARGGASIGTRRFHGSPFRQGSEHVRPILSPLGLPCPRLRGGDCRSPG
jgi:hypothetical protein